MKTILFLGTALLIAAPAYAMPNETAASMNHINTSDPKNPIYDAPSTPTSAAAANANFKGLRPMSNVGPNATYYYNAPPPAVSTGYTSDGTPYPVYHDPYHDPYR